MGGTGRPQKLEGISPMKTLLGIAVLALVTPRLHAASDWSVDGSLLAFTQGDALGGAIGVGYQPSQWYFGLDVLQHRYTETFGSGVSANTVNSRLTATSLVAKYFF